MKKTMEFKQIGDWLKQDRNIKVIVVVGLILIVLIFLYSMVEPTARQTANVAYGQEEYIASLEAKLEEIVSEIEGVGRIKVMITLEQLDESVYSKKETAVITTKTPVVRGVAVVCEGSGDVTVKQRIVETVSKVLGISTARVSVTH